MGSSKIGSKIGSTRKGRTKRSGLSTKKVFTLASAFKPAGDQPQAIESIVQSFEAGQKHQVLLGVTGSGKTFTMAHTIERLGVPALIMAPNKTLAAQLYAEFKSLFPHNAVEYFVSYYDYYQPEAYIPSTDTFIEKDSAINEQIDRMRHSATRSLLERKDVIIVSSVSCIYGLGSPEAYEGMVLVLEVNEEVKRDELLRELVRIQYSRNDIDFSRGNIRAKGDTVEIFPPYENERALRLEFFGDFIEKISWIDPLKRTVLQELDQIAIYPASHFVNSEERFKTAIGQIQVDLRDRIVELKSQMKLVEAQRIEQRTYYDIEMMEELGFCQGIENYSRYFTGRGAGEPPPTLLDYFPDDMIAFLDESHVTVPQIGGMYRGDRARKLNLVEHGFRLPSALDNRPLNFQEFEALMDKVLYVSATPGPYEAQKSGGLIVEQIIRPTGLVDPIITVRTAKHQVDDLLGEIRLRVDRKERVLVTTLTKKSAEDLTEYYEGLGIKVKYLHSDIDTLERTDILRDLRLGIFDVLIGINLLREGLDLPEVSLVAITDADKEGFLRSERSLIQTIGRAARNINGQVLMYADKVTDSMAKAISETDRRRAIQVEYNKKHFITPETIRKEISQGLVNIYQSRDGVIVRETPLYLVAENQKEYGTNPDQIKKKITDLRKKMRRAAEELNFEEAASLRDEVKRLELFQLNLLSPEALEPT